MISTRLRVLLLLIVTVVMAGGCVSERASPSFQRSTLDKARSPEENAELYTDLVQKMIAEDRLYAALAHLEEREQQFGRTDQLRVLRADILRKMGNPGEAERIYKKLHGTRFAGQADHGLGLIYARNNLQQGTTYLQRAVDRVPTDARMRNDLGYALLRQGRIRDARVQLATAYELDEKNKLNRNNYILLLLAEGNTGRARHIARRSEVSAQTMEALRDEARRLTAAAASSSGDIPSGPAPIVEPDVTPATDNGRQADAMRSDGVGGGGG